MDALNWWVRKFENPRLENHKFSFMCFRKVHLVKVFRECWHGVALAAGRLHRLLLKHRRSHWVAVVGICLRELICYTVHSGGRHGNFQFYTCWGQRKGAWLLGHLQKMTSFLLTRKEEAGVSSWRRTSMVFLPLFNVLASEALEVCAGCIIRLPPSPPTTSSPLVLVSLTQSSVCHTNTGV